MKQLDLAKFQRGRESVVEAAEFKFTIRRPPALDIARAGAEGVAMSIEFATRYVVGWDGVKESDLLPGGDPEPVAFDGAVFKAWIADRPDLWQPIANGVIAAYQRHEEATEARGKP